MHPAPVLRYRKVGSNIISSFGMAIRQTLIDSYCDLRDDTLKQSSGREVNLVYEYVTVTVDCK